MSSFYTKCIDKQTGEVLGVFAIDDYFGSHEYGYKIGENVLTEQEFDKHYKLRRDE